MTLVGTFYTHRHLRQLHSPFFCDRLTGQSTASCAMSRLHGVSGSSEGGVPASLEDALVFEDSEQSLSSATDDYEETASTAERNGQGRKKPQSFADSGLTSTLRKLRQLLWLVIFVIMGISSVGIFLFSRQKETTMFETEFASHGQKLLDTFQKDAHHKLEALNSLSTSITLNAIERQEKWPLVTIQNSALRLEGYLSVTGAAALLILPIVPPQLRTEWEEYSVQQQGWM
jgi:hypothetical protein